MPQANSYYICQIMQNYYYLTGNVRCFIKINKTIKIYHEKTKFI